MRVVFDARGYSIQAGGSFVYLAALANAVSGLGVSIRPIFHTLAERRLTRRFGPKQLLQWCSSLRQRRQAYAEEVSPQAADVFWSVHPNYFAYRGVARVLHIQDLAYLRTGYYKAARRQYWMRAMTRCLRDYEGLLAISEYTRNDVAETFDVDPARIAVVHHGLGAGFGDRPLRPWRRRDRPRLLSVGVHHPRKRLPEAVKLLADLRSQGVEATLRIVGPFSADTDAVRAEVARHHLGDAVEMTGPVSDRDLLQNYLEADALLWTSAYEGFGFPLAEAMATSLPVLSVDNTTVPEVTGGHFLDIDLDDIAESARRIRGFLANEAAVQSQVAAAHAYAQRFTWEEAARKSIDVWRRASDAH